MREKKALEFILFELPFHICRNNNDILNLAYELMIDNFEIALNVAYAIQLNLTIITQNYPILLTNYPEVKMISSSDFLIKYQIYKIEKNCCQLRNLLEQQDFNAANKETIRVLRQAAGVDDTCSINVPVLNQIHAAYFGLINQYWQAESGGKFGFSTQKTIWQHIHSHPDSQDDVREFFTQVGWEWAAETNSVNHKEINSKDETPKGYFPLVITNLKTLISFHVVLDELFSQNFD